MEPVFKDSVSKHNLKKLTETINYLEKENEDLRERVYDLENSIAIHKNMVNDLSERHKIDPQARYFIEQLKQESDFLHSKLQKMTLKNGELRSEMVIKRQMELQNQDLEHEDIKALKEEIEEMRQSLDRKEYLLQYTEQRNTELEKLIKK